LNKYRRGAGLHHLLGTGAPVPYRLFRLAKYRYRYDDVTDDVKVETSEITYPRHARWHMISDAMIWANLSSHNIELVLRRITMIETFHDNLGMTDGLVSTQSSFKSPKWLTVMRQKPQFELRH
jgi:hypothetical protein